ALTGTPGRAIVGRDALGREVAMQQTLTPPAPGHGVMLTLDRTIQYLAEREIDAAYRRTQARGAMAVALDPRTGDVLALAPRPPAGAAALGAALPAHAGHRPGDLGDRAPDAGRLRRRRQRWHAHAAPPREGGVRRRRPRAAPARAARRAPGRVAGDGAHARADARAGRRARHGAPGRRAGLRGRRQDGHRAEARSRDPALFART